MKPMKTLCVFLILLLLSSTYGCGTPQKIDETVYGTYGFFNEKEERNPNIKYRLIVGNVVWAVILSETIIAPIYFVLFDLYEPVRKIVPGEPVGSL